MGSNRKIKILHIESKDFSDKAKIILNSFADVEYADLKGNVAVRVSQCDALIVRLKHYIDRRIIDKAQNLKVIATSTTGENHIDVDYLKKKNVKLISLKGETSFLNSVSATAEHTFGLLFALVRNIPFAHNSVVNGKWDRQAFRGNEVAGKTIGIIGYGRLGKMVARYAKTFGMKVRAYDIDKKIKYPKYVEYKSLNSLLSLSDIVSIHLPLNKTTEKFVNAVCFEKMKKGVFFINTSRGAIVDEKALLKYLKAGHIQGAALDVLNEEEQEGFKTLDNALVKYAKKNKNLIITPHIGGAAVEAQEKTDIFIAEKLKKFFVKMEI